MWEQFLPFLYNLDLILQYIKHKAGGTIQDCFERISFDGVPYLTTYFIT